MTTPIPRRFRELGCTDHQVAIIADERRSVKETFRAVDERGEARLSTIVDAVRYARPTVSTNLKLLTRGYGVLVRRADPLDARQAVYAVQGDGEADVECVAAAPPCRECTRQSVRRGLCAACLDAVAATDGGGRDD